MKESRMRNWRRRLSGFLAFVMTASLVLSDAGIALGADAVDRFFQEHGKLTEDEAYSKATLSNASFENNREDELSISIFSGPDSDFRAGGTVYLDVHIKNETDSVITDGELSYKAKGVVDRHTYFEDPDEDPVVSGSFLEEIGDGISDSEDMELINDLEDGYDGDGSSEYEDGPFYYEDEDGYRSQEYVAGSAHDEDEDDEDENRDESGQLKSIQDITLAPGEIYTAHFVYEIDEHIAAAKNQNVLFRFKGKGGEDGRKNIRREQMFRYTVNFLNIDGVKFENGNQVETGEEVVMGIHTSLYDFDAVLEDSLVDLEELATPSNATPSNATSSNAFATPSDAEEEEWDEDEEEEDEDTFVIDLGDSTYRIEMVNAALRNFQVRKALVSDAYENMLICSFRVSKDVKPGVYFGSILQETRAGGKIYRSSQGFSLIVTGQGEITLESTYEDMLVTVSGPADAFPEAEELQVQVTALSPDQQKLLEEALKKMGAEDGKELTDYRAMDIKILADGAEIQPEGEIRVTVANIGLEQDEAAQNGETESGESVLKAFHLDEEQGQINEMHSFLQDNGDLVMNTDHFSAYLFGLELARNTDGAYGYVSHLDIPKVVTGMAPWDKDDTPGNDSSADNDIVRTFDTINYNVDVSMQAINDGISYTTGVLWLEAELPMDITKAKFDLDQMLWLESYTISYYDDQNQLLARGTDKEPSYTANQKASGGNQGTDSYQTPVDKQVLRGSYTLKGLSEDETVIPGTKTLSVGVKVLAARNQDIIRPTFKAWVDKNEENKEANGSSVDNSIQAKEIAVSAKARYNVAVNRSSEVNTGGHFDLATGQGVESGTATANTVSGRILGYNVVVQLYNESDTGEVIAKKLKGVELPQGDIVMELTLTEKVTVGFDQNLANQGRYTPILWDYKENITSLPGNPNGGKWGRNLFWNNVDVTRYGRTGPANKNTSSVFLPSNRSCYDGGTWTIPEAYKVTSVSQLVQQPIENQTYSVTVPITIEGIDFDLDNFVFPENDLGISGVKNHYVSYVGCFSSGYLQLMIQCPEERVETTHVDFYAQVADFSIHSLSGEKITKEVNTGDNRTGGNFTMYVPGAMTKLNSFTRLSGSTYADGFLGTYFWGINYDASAFAGDTIAMWGVTYLSSTSDYRMRAVNLLQKFDSEALSINDAEPISASISSNAGNASQTGDVTFLYAADPKYRDGWSSNNSAEMERMNTATEEDLIYFTTLEELERKEYTCVAVLAEFRDCYVYPDARLSLKIPVDVKDDSKIIGRTYCTVNTSRIWVNEGDMTGVSWSGGVYDSNTGKNSLGDKWKSPRFSISQSSTGGNYVKTEYDNGVVRPGTHSTGYIYGMSLLVVGYKASLIIKADADSYDMEKGQRTAVFTIDPIQTNVTSINYDQAGVNVPTTDLEITVSTEDKLTFMDGTYLCGGKVIGKEDAPTTITYRYDNNSKEGSATIYYKQMENKEVVFYIQDAVVGAQLPAIRLEAEIGNAADPKNDVENNDHLMVTATIAGESDRRAYSTTSGNMSQASIGIIRLNTTGVAKAVDKEVAELGDTITYTITYDNVGDTEIKQIYLYDILPYLGDGRGSNFHGTYDVESLTLDLPAGEEEATLYWKQGAAAELESQLSDWDEFEKVFTAANSVQTSNGTVKMEQLGTIAAVGAVIPVLPAAESLSLTITLKPKKNKAGDIYGNNAHTWIQGPSQNSALLTNRVQTVIISREISGRVWYDRDWDGLRADSEKFIANVQAVLQVQDGSGAYVPAKDVYGVDVPSVTTDADNGAYRFQDLPAGKYRVLFKSAGSPEVLKDYLKATEYQADTKVSGQKNNDGIAASELGYDYQIYYQNGQEYIELHSIEELEEGVRVESKANLDLGLVKGAKFRVKKVVENDAGLPNEPIDSEQKRYKFLIQVGDRTNGIDPYTELALGHNEVSGDIVLDDFPKGGVRTFTIEETVPMEYTLTKIESTYPSQWDNDTNTLTVHPGDEILVTLTNMPKHSGYFHHTAAVTNQKDMANGGNFTQGVPYKEPHGSGSTTPVSQTASIREILVAEVEKKERPYREKLLERGDDLRG